MKAWIMDTLCALIIFALGAGMIIGGSALEMNHLIKIHPEYAEAQR